MTLRYRSQLHHIGIRRTCAGTCIILIVQDLDIRIINAATGNAPGVVVRLHAGGTAAG